MAAHGWMEQSGVARRRIHPQRRLIRVPRRQAGGHENMIDVMDDLARLTADSPLGKLRRERPDVVKHLQGSDDVILSPADDGGLLRTERAAAALRIAELLRDDALVAHYRARLSALHPSGAL